MSTLEQYFSQPKFVKPRRLILAVIADVKMGKTTLGLTASDLGPLAMLDFDYGLEGPVSDFMAKGNTIYHCTMDVPMTMILEKSITAEDYKKSWYKAKEAYYAALGDPNIKSVLVDTGSEWCEAGRLAAFGKLDHVRPHHYAEPNAEFRKFFRDALETTKNLIVTLKTKDEYINDQRTGKKVFSGMTDTLGLVQMVVNLWKRDQEYGLTITSCRHKRALEGIELPASIATFPQLLTLVHGPEE